MRSEQNIERRLGYLDAVARSARQVVRRAAKRGNRIAWVGRAQFGSGSGSLMLTPDHQPEMRGSAVAVPAPGDGPVAALTERELDRWAVKMLWAALDNGLLPNDVTEEVFTAAFLQRG